MTPEERIEKIKGLIREAMRHSYSLPDWRKVAMNEALVELNQLKAELKKEGE